MSARVVRWVRRTMKADYTDTLNRPEFRDSAGATSTELARLKELERENRELRQANDIIKKA